MSMVEFSAVAKHFGTTQVLHDINLRIDAGEVVVIIGPSGSGKSTLLRCINKLEAISSGTLLVAGMHLTDPHVNECEIRREAGMVFQQFHLFPHLTALENVMFGPIRVRRMSQAAAANRRWRCWNVSAYANEPSTIHQSFQAASSSAWLSLARWR